MIDSDLSLISLTLEKNVVVYQQSNGTITLATVEAYQNDTAVIRTVQNTTADRVVIGPDGNTVSYDFQIKSAPTDISFHHFSATNPDASPLIYIYYQLNESTIAEISYNTTSERWAFDSMGISIL